MKTDTHKVISGELIFNENIKTNDHTRDVVYTHPITSVVVVNKSSPDETLLRWNLKQKKGKAAEIHDTAADLTS